MEALTATGEGTGEPATDMVSGSKGDVNEYADSVTATLPPEADDSGRAIDVRA
jgi:hypothetical protein